MAEVFLAVVAGPAGFNKLFVVKLMKPELLEEGEHKAMFLDEGKLAARLNHPNIVQTHEVQIQEDQYFLVMEYLDGQPLHRILRRAHKTETHLPLHWHVHFLCEVLAALEYAHDLRDYDGTPLKVVHRDVTPHNVFVTYAGQTKLCDFGIAKTMASSVETRAGILRGKVAYMAPEQVLGSRVDNRADLFAVGVMLWEAMARRRMWDGCSEIQVMQALSHGDLPRVRDIDANVDPELERIVTRALAVRPDDRFQNARDFRTALEGFLFAQTARIDPHAIGEWVGKLFEKERSNLQAVIQDQLTGPQQPPPGFDSLPPPHVGQSGDSAPSRSAKARYAPAQPSGSVSSGAPSARVGKSLTIPSVEVRALKPRKTYAAVLGVVAALGVFLAVAFGVLIVRTAASRSPPSDVEPLRGTASVEPQVEPAGPSPVIAPTAGNVRIRIHVTPANAKITLDRKTLKGNPYIEDRPPDNLEHELQLEAPGYETESRKLRFDQPRDIEIAMKKLEAASTGGVVRAPRPGTPPAESAAPTDPDKVPEIKVKKKPPSTQLDPDDPWK
jgi:serine/threonine-protein kinase